MFYVLFMELGVLVWVRLVLACMLFPSAFTGAQKLTDPDLENIDGPKDVQCNVLSDDLCKILHKDPYTIVLSIWAAFQLTWVTMLLCVQLLQVARNRRKGSRER